MPTDRNADTQVEKKGWEQLCAELTDEALLSLSAELSQLSPSAQAAVTSEVTHRQPKPLRQPLDPEDFVSLLRFTDLQDQALTKGVLESAGITCFEFGYTIRNSRLILQVQRKDVPAACEVLSQPIPESFDVEGVGNFQQPRCPACGSLDVSFEGWQSMRDTRGITEPVEAHQDAWKCQACSHVWPATGDEV
jgi:hypothetical protein